MSAKKRKSPPPVRPSAVVGRAARTWTHSSLVQLGLLMLVTLAVYAPAWHGGPLWDDDAHLTRPALQSLGGLWRIWFVVGATQQYYPVVHSAFWVFHRLWGDDPLGYHLVNILLHATSAWLFVRVLQRLAVPGAWLAGLIFALHPVEVESVAWMTELKNTLSGALYLGAALAYLHFDRARSRRGYAVALGLFALALLSKTVTATLPAALLVVLWWQRGRVRWREDVLPLVPWVALGLAAGLVTAWVERTQIGAQGAAFDFTLVERSLIAGRVIVFYLAKLVWPAPLIFIYPRWTIDAHAWAAYLYPFGVMVALAGLWAIRGWSRAPLAVALLFIGTLVPALGFVNVYPFVFSFVADHFQYLAGLPVIAGFAAGVTRLARHWRLSSVVATTAALVLLAPLTVLTWAHGAQYADAETLYRATLAQNPACWMAHNNLGQIIQGRARASSDSAMFEDAVAHYREAIRLNPAFSQAHNNLGGAFLDLGRFDDAATEYREALRLKSSDPEIRRNLGLVAQKQGNALLSAGRLDEAVAAYQSALQLNPDDAEAHHNRGSALAQLGRLEEAVAEYRDALRLNPSSANANRNLGNTLLRMGRVDEAIDRFRDAVRFEPNAAILHDDLANALDQAGKHDEAIAELKEAIRRQPDFVRAYNDLGIALAQAGRYEEAVTNFREALRLKPDFGEARANLARALAMIKS